MKRLTICLTLLISTFVTTVCAQGQDAIDYQTQVVPLLRRSCVACHNQKKAEGGLALDSFPALAAGGDSGDAIVAGDAGQGELLSRLIAEDDSAMPPDDNNVGAPRLSTDEVKLIVDWVKAGAVATADPAGQSHAGMVRWQAVAESLKPVYAADLSADGNYLGYGFGNLVIVVTDPFGADPSLNRLKGESKGQDQTKDPGLGQVEAALSAHVDLVQSVVFSPDSQRLATGGFRTVKIWRRSTEYQQTQAGVWAQGRILWADGIVGSMLITNESNELVLLDLATGKAIASLIGHQHAVVATAWTLDRTALFSCDQSGTIIRWTLADEKPAQIHLLPGIESPGIESPVQGLPSDSKVDATFTDLPPVPLIPADGVSIVSLPQAVNPRSLVSCFGRVVAAGISDVKHLAAVSQHDLLVQTGTKVFGLRNDTASQETGSVGKFVRQDGFDLFKEVVAIDRLQVGEIPTYVIAAENGKVDFVEFQTGSVIRSVQHEGSVHGFAINSQQTKLATFGDQKTMLWNVADATGLIVLQGDYDRRRNQADSQDNLVRQESLVGRVQAVLPTLTKAIEVEQVSQGKVQDGRDKAAAVVVTKGQELAAALIAVDATKASIVVTEKAIEDAKQQLVNLQQELEAKNAAATQAQTAKADADLELAKHDQALATVNESVQRVQALVPEQEKRIELETQELQRLRTLKEQYAGQAEPSIGRVTFSVDESKLIVQTADDRLNVFSLVDGRLLAGMTSPVAAQMLVCDSQHRLLVMGGGKQVQLNLQMPWKLEKVIGRNDTVTISDRVTALDFSPDGKYIAVGSGPPSRFGDLKIFSVESGALERDFGQLHSDSILGVRFSPDGKKIATVGADKVCRVTDVATGASLKTLEGHTHHVMSIAWQDDGQALSTAGADASVKTWDLASGEKRRSIEGFGKEVSSIDYLGKTDQILTTCIDGQVRLHNSSNGQQIRTYAGMDAAAYTIASSRDGKYVVAGGQSGLVWIWAVDDGKLLRKLPEK